MKRIGLAAAACVAALVALSGCDAQETPALGDVNTASCGLSGEEHGSFVSIPSGAFIKGANPVYPEERATLRLHVDGFELQRHEVTNAQFAAFVEATGYVTDAEKSGASGRPDAGSAVFGLIEDGDSKRQPWSLVAGATWKAPEGPGSSIESRAAHPVVHVSLADARAYAAWAGGRVPTEVEWEYAAATGLPDADVSTSGAYAEDGTPRANTWQGVFPFYDQAEDGFSGSSPVGCFAPDRHGLSDMIGNVWELTDTPYGDGTTTIKGGSYLCADNFCRRYRPEARQPQETHFSSNHIGFRIIRD